MFGRDKHARPIVIVKPMALARDGMPELPSLMRAVTFQMLYVRKHMMHKGKVENVLLVVDLEQANFLSIHVGFFKKFFTEFQSYFRCTTCKVVVLNSGQTIVALWSAAKMFI